MRSRIIFGLTHFYPIFIAAHLYFGSWSRRSQVMFNTVPLLIFGGIILTWLKTSNIRLSKEEIFYLKYFLLNLFFIYAYYSICVFSLPMWVYNKNCQASVFILIILIFYIFKKREY